MRPTNPETSLTSTKPLLILLALIPVLLSGLCSAADTESSAPSTSAYLYVGSYVGHYPNFTDYITGYSVAADGSLTSLSGSPITGPSFGLVSVRNFVFGDDGRHIATYTRGSDGSLTETSIVDDYRYAQDPYGMSIYALNPDRSGQTLTTVLSCGSCNSYTIPLTIASNGQLTFDSNFPPAQGAAKWSGVFYFSPDNRFAYTEYWQDGASEFRRNPDGTLTYVQATGSAPQLPNPNPNPYADVCLPGDIASSTSTGFAAIAWWSGIYCSDGPAYAFATYTVASDGSLQLVPGTTFVPPVREESMAFDSTGRYLAIAGCLGQYYCSGNPAALQIYKIQTSGTLTPVGDVQVVTTTDGFVNVQWDSAGHVFARGDAVNCTQNFCESDMYVYNFDGQSLTLAPGSPHSLNNVVGIAVASQQ